MTNPATASDVEARFRPLSSAETVLAQTLLGDAWALLLGRRPTLDADIEAGTVSRENAVRVLAAMVVRVMRNPDGLLEESIDDYKYRRDSLVSSGVLHVTSDELADVSPGRRVRRSVRLTVYGDE